MQIAVVEGGLRARHTRTERCPKTTKMLLTAFTTLLVVLVVGCDGSSDQLRSENESLRRELDKTKQELDELRFGASRLLKEIEAEAKSGAWQKVKTLGDELRRRHPGSPEATQAQKTLAAAEAALQKAERDAKLAETKRQEEQQHKQLAEERRLANALSKMTTKVDKVEKITWYRDRSSPHYTNREGFFLYIGKGAGQPWLRFRVTYYADEWLFIKSFLIVADGRRFEYDAVRFERDNSGGSIWEWYDVSASARDLEMLRQVIGAKNAVIRFNGQHYKKDREITSAEKGALRNVLDAYKVLGGT